MRLIFYILFLSQIFNFLEVIAEKINEDSLKSNRVKWEKVPEKKSIPLKKIIWKSYNDDESYFEKNKFTNQQKNKQELLEITKI